MSPVATEKLYVCPGDTHPISRAVHLSRLAAYFPGCRDCPLRSDTGQLPAKIIERVQNTVKRVERKSLFTTEGVRGVHRNELTRAKAASVATAFAGLLWEEAIVANETEVSDRPTRPARPSVIVGYDERPSSPDIVTGVTAALRRMGCQVIDIALSTKPCLWFTVDHLQAAGGVFITGSGCEPSWTGLDFIGRAVRPLSHGGGLSRLEQRLREPAGRQTRHAGPHRAFQAFVPYEASLWKHFHALRPLKIGFACPSRLVRRTLERTFANLPCRLIPVNIPDRLRDLSDPKDADATRMGDGVRGARADLGVIIGDDGQSCAFFDEHGRLIPQSRITELVAAVTLNLHPGRLVAIEHAAFDSLKPVIEKRGGECIDAGETLELMSNAIRDQRAIFGGGTGPRMWFGDTFPTCDAVLSIAKVLEALSQSDAPFSEVVPRNCTL